MNLKDTLKSDMISAKKKRDKTLVDLLSSVLGELDRISKSPSNEQAEKIIRKMHDNLINEIGTIQSICEAKFLEKYLPQLMSKEEIETEINIIITDINAETMKDMGKVMGEFSKLFKGKADMKIVSDIVRKKLQ